MLRERRIEKLEKVMNTEGPKLHFIMVRPGETKEEALAAKGIKPEPCDKVYVMDISNDQ